MQKRKLRFASVAGGGGTLSRKTKQNKTNKKKKKERKRKLRLRGKGFTAVYQSSIEAFKSWEPVFLPYL